MFDLRPLRDTFHFFARHLQAILLVCLPWILLQSLLRQQVELAFPGQEAWPLLADLIFAPLYTAGLILYVRSRENVITLSVIEIWKLALRLWPALAVLTALSALMILLGFSFFVIPGLYIMIKLAFAEFYLVLENQNPLRAMMSSFQSTEGQFWRLLVNIIVLLVPIWGLDFWMTTQIADNAVGRFMLSVCIGILQLSLTLVAYRLYTETEWPRHQ